LGQLGDGFIVARAGGRDQYVADLDFRLIEDMSCFKDCAHVCIIQVQYGKSRAAGTFFELHAYRKTAHHPSRRGVCRGRPAHLEKGGVQYQVRIVTDMDDELASREVPHSATKEEKCRFTNDDFSKLSEDALLSAKIVVSVIGEDAVEPQESEEFVPLTPGDVSRETDLQNLWDRATHASRRLARPRWETRHGPHFRWAGRPRWALDLNPRLLQDVEQRHLVRSSVRRPLRRIAQLSERLLNEAVPPRLLLAVQPVVRILVVAILHRLDLGIELAADLIDCLQNRLRRRELLEL
jgi:hypothetical protein